MKATKSLIQQIANGETTLSGEPVAVANMVLNNGLWTQFSRYAFFYDGDENNILDVQDLLLDYPCHGAEIRIKVEKHIHPTGTLQVFGMTASQSLEQLAFEISNMPYVDSEKLENSTFKIRGVKGEFAYISTYFHYCFGEGHITVDQLLEMIRVKELKAA